MKHKHEYHSENKGDSLSALELKEALEKLAAQVGQGSITVGEDGVEATEPYFFKSRVRVKDGHLRYQISFESTLAGNEKKERLGEAPLKSGKTEPVGKKGPKAIKKELKNLWKEVVPLIDKGKAPSRETMQQVLQLCLDYDDWTEVAWKEEWKSCKLKLEECFAAAADGRADEAARLMAEVKGLIKGCHDKYK